MIVAPLERAAANQRCASLLVMSALGH